MLSQLPQGSYNKEELTEEKEDEYDDYIAIDYEEYNELLESEDYFFIAIGRTGCGYCDKLRRRGDEQQYVRWAGGEGHSAYDAH